MRILISNDDGIAAPGIKLLEMAARQISSDVWVIAPDAKRTAAGSSLTIARPLTMLKSGVQSYACSGTPADCIVAAMTWMFKDALRPDLVLSGVNDGLNIAEDVAYSGTLGIAREAVFWGLPAIGFSRVKNADSSPADADFLAGLITRFWAKRQKWYLEGNFLSVNLPSVLPAPIAQAKIGRDKIARTSNVIRDDENGAELVVPRGRAGLSEAGDENDLLSQGLCVVNRLQWNSENRLDDGFVESLADV